MRLNEITKDRFKKKLKYPMELVDGITQEVERVNDSFNQDWINATYDQEFGDDYVAWNIELKYDSNPDQDRAFADTLEKVYQAIVQNYKWEDISISWHRINREPGYLLLGIQLDV
jgi:hypothetical protein